MLFRSVLESINNLIWGPPLLILLVGTGIYLTIRLKLLQVFKLPLALKYVFGKDEEANDKDASGDVSSFGALCTALSATIGTGNIMIEITKMRTNRWGYFKQFVNSFPPLLPLLTNFVPMLSLGIRLFGNAFAGFCIMTLLYQMFNALLNGFALALAPVIMPVFHAYFDLFSGFIQTIVFVMITMMDIAQEAPEMETQEALVKAVDMKAAVEMKAKQMK